MITEKDTLNSRYRLERKIGQGGFAQVFLATDLLLERTVAVKVLNPELTEDEDFLERFGKEAKAVAALDHPNILTVYDYGQSAGTAYLVMPFVEGGTLHDKLKREKKLTPAQAARYLTQIAAALDYAHRRNIVHRDIKPQNMLLRDDDNRLLLTDFGIAKVLSSASAQSRTGAMGTLSYMAPEQLNGNVGISTDIYALGCVLFQMLTGSLPYTGPTEQVVMGHLSGPIPSLTERTHNQLPPSFQSIIDKALAKRSEERYQSAGELAIAFAALLDSNEATLPGKPISGTLPIEPDKTQAVRTPPNYQNYSRTVAQDTPNSRPPAYYESTPPAGPFQTPSQPGYYQTPPQPGQFQTPPAGPFQTPSQPGYYQTPPQPGQFQTPPQPGQFGMTPPRPPAGPFPPPPQSGPLPAVKPPSRRTPLLIISGVAALLVIAAIVAVVVLIKPGTSTSNSTSTDTPFSDIKFSGKTDSILSFSSTKAPLTAVAYSRNGEFVATSDINGFVGIWEVRRALLVQNIDNNKVRVRALTFTPDNTGLVGVSTDGIIRIWDIQNGQAARVQPVGSYRSLNAVAVSPDGKTVYAGGDEQQIFAWTLADNKVDKWAGQGGSILSMAISGNGVFLATGGDTGLVEVTNTTDGKQLRALKQHTGPVVAVAFSPDGKHVASGSNDNSVIVWDVESGSVSYGSQNGTGVTTQALAFTPNSSLLVIGNSDSTIGLMSMNSGNVIQQLKGNTGSVTGLAVSSDGDLLLSGSADNSLRLWQIGTVTPNLHPETATPATQKTAAATTAPATTTAAVATTAPPTTAPVPTPVPPTNTPVAPPPPSNDPKTNAIKNALLSLPGTTSSYVILPDNRVVENDGDRQLPSASTIKLWIAATLLQKAKEGQLDLNSAYTVQQSDIAPGTGILSGKVGNSFSLNQLMETMLIYSDNSAANILIGKLGGFDPVNAYAQANGYNQTKLQRKLGLVDANNDNYTSAHDAATFMQKLLRHEIVDPPSSDRILKVLTDRLGYSGDQNFFAGKLPPGTQYRHISGTGTGVRNEVGFVTVGPGAPAIIAIYTYQTGNDTAAEGAVAGVIRQIFDAARV